MIKLTSLKAKLLSSLAIILVLGISVTSIISFIDTSHEIDELFDAQLTQTARVLNNVVELYSEHLPNSDKTIVVSGWLTDKEGDSEATSMGHVYERKVAFQVWRDQKTLILRSESAPETAFTDLEPGYKNVTLFGESWRVFTLYDNKYGYWMQISERGDIRGELTSEIVIELIVLLVLGLTGVSVISWKIININLRPLSELEQKLENIDLTSNKPIYIQNAPKEISLVINAFNDLFRKINNSIEREVRFIEDAAHELKTPLTVLYVHAQNLENESNPDKKKVICSKLKNAIIRCKHVAEQLLTYSRLENENPNQASQINLVDVVQETVEELAPLIISNNQDISLNCQLNYVPILATRTQIHTLIKNLVDNAFKYSPPLSLIKIGIEVFDKEIKVYVEDNGPGLTEKEKSLVFNRFYRCNPGDAIGSGLGMSIVARIVNQINATIDLQDAPGAGLVVVITIPSIDSKPERLSA